MKVFSIFMLSDITDAASIGSTLHEEQHLDSHLCYKNFVKVILNLGKVLLQKSVPPAHSIQKSQQQFKLMGRALLQDRQQISALSNAQRRESFLVISKEFRGLSCCNSPDQHSRFACPYLNLMQRPYFACRYFFSSRAKPANWVILTMPTSRPQPLPI